MTRTWQSYLVLAGVVATATPAAARPVREDDPALARYVARARKSNPDLVARALEIEKRRADRSAVRAAYLPSLDLDARYTRTYGNQIDLGELINPAYAALNQLLGMPAFPTDIEGTLPFRFDARLRLTQPVFAPKIIAGTWLASAGVSAAEAERAIASRDIRTGVRVAYLQHARAALSVDLLKRSRPLFEEGARVSQLLADAGKATGDAVPRSQAELAQIDQQIREVERLRQLAARTLNLLVDAPIDAEVPVPTLDVPAALPGKVDELVANARRRRSELAVIEAGMRAQSAERSLARANYLPSVAVAVDYGFLSNAAPSFEDDYVAISAVASWNLFAGGRDHNKARAAGLAQSALVVRRGQLEDKIELEVRQAWLDADTARTAIASADERIASAKKAYDVVARRYKAGSVPQIELIGARTALLQAETDRIVAITDLHLRLVELDRVAQTDEGP